MALAAIPPSSLRVDVENGSGVTGAAKAVAPRIEEGRIHDRQRGQCGYDDHQQRRRFKSTRPSRSPAPKYAPRCRPRWQPPGRLPAGQRRLAAAQRRDRSSSVAILQAPSWRMSNGMKIAARAPRARGSRFAGSRVPSREQSRSRARHAADERARRVLRRSFRAHLPRRSQRVRRRSFAAAEADRAHLRRRAVSDLHAAAAR